VLTTRWRWYWHKVIQSSLAAPPLNCYFWALLRDAARLIIHQNPQIQIVNVPGTKIDDWAQKDCMLLRLIKLETIFFRQVSQSESMPCHVWFHTIVAAIFLEDTDGNQENSWFYPNGISAVISYCEYFFPPRRQRKRLENTISFTIQLERLFHWSKFQIRSKFINEKPFAIPIPMN